MITAKNSNNRLISSWYHLWSVGLFAKKSSNTPARRCRLSRTSKPAPIKANQAKNRVIISSGGVSQAMPNSRLRICPATNKTRTNSKHSVKMASNLKSNFSTFVNIDLPSSLPHHQIREPHGNRRDKGDE